MNPDERPDERRVTARQSWEEAAAGWGRNAEHIREWGMAVSSAMIDALDLQPGQRILELAAGPGDTGFMAAELIRPGGILICSDGAEAMVQIARGRATEMGISDVEFRCLELEWIDLDTASVDAILCRWGLMLAVDPEASAHEMRRVLRPQGRVAVAVWEAAEHNPWATIPTRALVELGHQAPPDPSAPSLFTLGEEDRLDELMADAGFTERESLSVPVVRRYEDVDSFIYETRQMSPSFGPVVRALDPAGQAELRDRIARAAAPFTGADGGLELPGRSLVLSATA